MISYEIDFILQVHRCRMFECSAERDLYPDHLPACQWEEYRFAAPFLRALEGSRSVHLN